MAAPDSPHRNRSAPAAGSRPAEAEDEQSASIAVQKMFDRIAPRYDLLNHLLSLNIDRLWWRRSARSFRHILARPEAQILDICCGTGHMALALLHFRPKSARPLLAADFAHQMLLRASPRLHGRGALLVEADALRLPVADASLDLITTAFGFRNLANYRAGLEEFYRVLKPGGELGVLDFSEPAGIIGRLYAFYFRRVLPRIGALVSGAPEAYSYLPASVRKFPAPVEMLAMMRSAGFSEVSWTPYNFGVAGLFRGLKR